MYRRILVAVENSAADRTILAHVAALARLTGAELLLVHVADGWAARNFDELKLRESEEMKADRAYLESLQARARRAGPAPCGRSWHGRSGHRARSASPRKQDVDLDRDVHARPPLPLRRHPRRHGRSRAAPGEGPGPAAPRAIRVIILQVSPYTASANRITAVR